jgi:hypothetical protein
MKKIKINQIDDITFPSHHLVCGPTMSGKSLLVRWMIYKRFHKKFDAIYVLSGSMFNEDYDFVPEDYKCNNVVEMNLLITGILKTQEEIKRSGEVLPSILIILDDIVGVIDRSSKMDITPFELLYSRGRHLNISVIAIIQNITLLTPTIRLNAKYVYYSVVLGKQIDVLYEIAGHGFDSKKKLKELCNHVCKDYRFICFDCHGSERKIKVLKANVDEANVKFILVPKGAQFSLKEMKELEDKS